MVGVRSRKRSVRRCDLLRLRGLVTACSVRQFTWTDVINAKGRHVAAEDRPDDGGRAWRQSLRHAALCG